MNDENDVNGANTVSNVPTSAEEVVNNYGGTTNSNGGAYTSGVQNSGPSVLGGDYSFNQNSSKEKKSPALKILLEVIAVIVVVALVGVGVYAITSGSKTEYEKVFGDDYLFRMQAGMIKEMEKSNKNTIEISVNVDDTLSKFGGKKIGLSDATLRESNIKEGENINNALSLVLEDKEVASLKFAKTGNLYGIIIPGLIDKYIAIEDNNLKALAEKFGVDEEIVEQLPNSIEEYINKNSNKVDKYKGIVKRYVKVISKELNKYMATEDNIELEVDGTKYNTKKYSISINEKNGAEILIGLFRSMENDKELFNMLKEDKILDDVDVDTYEEWKNGIADTIEELEESLANNQMDEETVLIVISAYTYKGNTIGFEIASEESDFNFLLAGHNDNKESYLSLLADASEMQFGITFTQTKENKEYKGNVSANVKFSIVTFELDLCDIDVIVGEARGLDKLEKLSKSDVFLINNATEEEIESKLNEIAGSSNEYLQQLISKLPQSLQDSISGILDDSSNNDYDFDEDYNKTGDFKINGPQVNVLSDLQEKYNKVKIGMTESELVATLGAKYTKNDYGTWSFLEWHNDSNTGSVVVYMEEGKADSKELSTSSYSYDNVMLSKELNSTLRNLPGKIGSVKNGMTLEQVKAILGDASFESKRTSSEKIDYTWYDKDENYASIEFYNNKVIFIGPVFKSY